MLERAFFYSFSDDIIDDFIGYTYRNTQIILNDGNIVRSFEIKDIKGKPTKVHKTNFVGIGKNMICHVRPHAKNFSDQLPLPVKDKVTGYTNYEKQCFWIDTRFIKAISEGEVDDYIAKARAQLKSEK